MNERPEKIYEIRQKIRTSMSIDDLVQLMDDIIEQFSSDERDDLVSDVFNALREITINDVFTGKKIILEHLLPYLEQDSEALPKGRNTTWQSRNCLVEWLDQYPEDIRYTLRQQVLDELLLRLRVTHSQSICWTLSRIGFRRPDITDALGDIAHHHNDEIGDTALSTIVALGLPLDERSHILEVLHQRATQRINQPLISALYQLADPSSIPIVYSSWLQANATQEPVQDALYFLAWGILPEITDKVENEEIQDQIWQIIVDLFARSPERIPFGIHVSGSIIPQCNSSSVVPTVLNWLGRESETPWDRYLFYLRLTDCVRPHQL